MNCENCPISKKQTSCVYPCETFYIQSNNLNQKTVDIEEIKRIVLRLGHAINKENAHKASFGEEMQEIIKECNNLIIELF